MQELSSFIHELYHNVQQYAAHRIHELRVVIVGNLIGWEKMPFLKASVTINML